MLTVDFSQITWLTGITASASGVIFMAGFLLWRKASSLKDENESLHQKHAQMAAELVTMQDLLQRKHQPALFSMEEVASILALDTMRSEGMYCNEGTIIQDGAPITDGHKQRLQMEALRKLSLVLSQHKDDPLLQNMNSAAIGQINH
ncbi:MAG: hypothetical protein P8176_14855 [Gammaproteobacteria bacterium]